MWWLHDDNAGWDITDDTMKYNNVKIRVGKSDDSLYHVKIYKYSAGSSVSNAQTRAAKTLFNANSQDSFLNLSSALMIDKNSKFRGQGVVVEIEMPAGKKIKFDASVIDAYNPWVVRRSAKAGRYWGRRWQSDWDYDDYFNLQADIDYMMGEDGVLFDPANPPKKDEDNNEYRYNENNKKRQDRKQELQKELKQIEQQDKQDSMQKKTEGIKKDTVAGITKNNSVAINSTMFSLVSLFN